MLLGSSFTTAASIISLNSVRFIVGITCKLNVQVLYAIFASLTPRVIIRVSKKVTKILAV